MRPSTSQIDGRHRVARLAILPALIAIVAAVALPASASAAPCPVTPGVFATAWLGGSGNMGSENWTNGTPTGACDVSIVTPGSDVIEMTGGFNMRSLTLGGAGSTPQLVISDQSPNTNLDAQPAGITIAAGASVTLTCQVGGCPVGGPDIYSGGSPFVNAGTITVDANTGGGAVVGGQITNTGTIAFGKSASLGGKVTNKGAITVADGAVVTNQGNSCGDTSALVKNDTGGSIDGGATGLLSVRNFDQGAGTTKDVTIPCGGTLHYSGSGSSEIRATGGFNLTGEMQAGQALTISAESSNTNVFLQSDFTNQGSITLTCPPSPGECSGGAGGGAGFSANGKAFTNAGSFTVAADSGTGAGLSGGLTNTGTMTFNQTGGLGGLISNQGTLNIADGKTVFSTTNCGDTGPRFKHESGQINGIGTGNLNVTNYEQGNGTTSGSVPVVLDCGSLKYTGTGASVVQANSSMTGNIAAGQTLRIVGQVNSGAFTNAGTIVFDQSGSNPTLNTGTVSNTGKIELVGASANTANLTGGQLKQTGAGAEIVIPAGTKLNPGAPIALEAGTLRGSGTITGAVVNSGGVVKPGDSPGTLSLTGSYVQEAGGRLEIEVAGTGAGQFDALAVGGVATLGGTLALVPSGGYADSAAIGDSVAFLTYGGSVVNGFAQTTVNPSLSCPKVFSTSNDSGAKALKATVTNSGATCGGSGGGGGGGGGGSVDPVPTTKLGVHPGPRVKTKQAKLKVKFGFSSPNVPTATFQCKLDKGAYKACKSPKSFKVKPGRHKFSVRAVGPGGTDATPATFKFKVIKQKG
ncbi:MAG TPA: hypothetical protein VIT89_07560 [Solirubrobacterales bacterium]